MAGFSTPEEAALTGYPPGFARVVGVVVRGDEAVVAVLVNADAFPDGAYETETASCRRDGDAWDEEASSSSDGGFIRTGEDRCTVVQLYEAPADAVAGRFRLGEIEERVAVEDGFAFVVFDDVPYDETKLPTANGLGHEGEAVWAEMGSGTAPWSWPYELPSIVEWLPPTRG